MLCESFYKDKNASLEIFPMVNVFMKTKIGTEQKELKGIYLQPYINRVNFDIMMDYTEMLRSTDLSIFSKNTFPHF